MSIYKYINRIATAWVCKVSTNPKPKIMNLAARDITIIAMTAYGMTDKEIARRLFLSHIAICKIQEQIREKLGAKNRAEVAFYAGLHYKMFAATYRSISQSA